MAATKGLTCAACRIHGKLTPKKGHAHKCRFLGCECGPCLLLAADNEDRKTKMAILREQKKVGMKKWCGHGPPVAPLVTPMYDDTALPPAKSH